MSATINDAGRARESWTSPPQLLALAAFYRDARAHPASIPDAVFFDTVTRAHWPTNCWSYTQVSLAIVAHGCVLRPQLTRELIALPIAAMMAGGLDSSAAMIEYGTACAAIAQPYVAFILEGRRWMAQQWPTLHALVDEVVASQWQVLMQDDS